MFGSKMGKVGEGDCPMKQEVRDNNQLLCKIL